MVYSVLFVHGIPIHPFHQVYIWYFTDPPGVVSITPDKNTFYCKKDGKPYADVVCKTDCLPQCTYKWEREIYAGHNPLFTTGYSLFATKNINSRCPRSTYRYRCIASNDNHYSYSKWITVEIKGKSLSLSFSLSLSLSLSIYMYL